MFAFVVVMLCHHSYVLFCTLCTIFQDTNSVKQRKKMNKTKKQIINDEVIFVLDSSVASWQ